MSELGRGMAAFAAAWLDVIPGVDGHLDEVFESWESANTFVNFGVFRGLAPHSDFAVLVAGEDTAAGDDNGFDKAGGGLEAGELLLITPYTDVLAVRASEEEAGGGGEGVYVAFFTDKRADETGAGGEKIGSRRSRVVVGGGSGGGGVRVGIGPRGHVNGGAFGGGRIPVGEATAAMSFVVGVLVGRIIDCGDDRCG